MITEEKLEERCVYCGVPMSIHNTECGWENASAIIFPWETTIASTMTGNEKQRRYMVRNLSEENQKLNLQTVKNGIDLIQTERYRQIAKGYTAEHDDDETAMQLSYAAAAYIVNAQNLYFKDHSHYDGMGDIVRLQPREIETRKWKDEWPWSDKDGRRKADILTSLVKASALIVAEIENELRNK